MNDIQDEFLTFKIQTKVQLLISQLQFFQSLAAINLAFVAIMVATSAFTVNFWFVTASIISILLIIYITSFCREIIDAQDKNLNKTEEFFEEINEKHSSNDNEGIENLCKSLQKAKSGYANYSYGTEIIIFAFINSLLFHVIGFLTSKGFFIEIPASNLLIFIISLSFLITFKDWSMQFTKKISDLLQIKIC